MRMPPCLPDFLPARGLKCCRTLVLAGLVGWGTEAWAGTAAEEGRQPSPPVPAVIAPIRVKHPRPEVDPRLSRGYDNLRAGRLEEARRDYREALRSDPKNIDAQLGLAAIAQSQGHVAAAHGHYRQALEADPRNAFALAAILALTALADPIGTESRLKTLLTFQPESAALNFCLGNIYSRQSRWPEARQQYFNAVASEGDNPDYLFNFAVSLDHLREAVPAARYYRLALDAGMRQPAAFDRQQATSRLAAIETWIEKGHP